MLLGIYQGNLESEIKSYKRGAEIWKLRAQMADDFFQQSMHRLQEYQNEIINGRKEFSGLFREENERLGRLIQIRDMYRDKEDKYNRTREYLEWLFLS